MQTDHQGRALRVVLLGAGSSGGCSNVCLSVCLKLGITFFSSVFPDVPPNTEVGVGGPGGTVWIWTPPAPAARYSVTSLKQDFSPF